MPAPTACRVIVDAPAPGVWNMAVDEALLESGAAGATPTLRLYRWERPTLSLGYFQRHADRRAHAPSDPLPAVRRSSGGGALVHDHELTYSLTLPPGDPRTRDAVALTCTAHRALVAAVEELAGVRSLTTCAAAIDSAAGREPFLCFLRRSVGDVLATDAGGEQHKICGSAQRRRRGALLQHGGALLRRSTHAPELPGLNDVLGGDLDGAELGERWTDNLLEALGLRRESGELTPAERLAAERFAAERFGETAWTERR